MQNLHNAEMKDRRNFSLNSSRLVILNQVSYVSGFSVFNSAIKSAWKRF
jgi:hypothetical protein